MSKIGKKIYSVPAGVTVAVGEDALAVKGPRGELTVPLASHLKAVLEGAQLRFVPEKKRMTKFEISMWGTTAALARNAIEGVVKGFEKKLELNGVGFRAALEGKTLKLNLGFSHPVMYVPPAGIELAVEKNIITVRGIDRALVGEVSAKIRAFKKPEPYKGKGIKYIDETLRRKAGKRVAAEGAAK